MWKGTRTRKSPGNSESLPVARSRSCSRRGPSSGDCWRTWSTNHARTGDRNMQHLAIERLAELADGEPTAPERDHLADCAMCATELVAYQRVVAMAADERRRIAPPLTDWGSLRGTLHRQGIIATPIEARDRRELAARISSVGDRKSV